MSFFHDLGSKISGAAHRLGVKASKTLKTGTKFVAKHADAVADVAGVVGNVAGIAAAGLAATGVGAPVAAALAGVSAGAKVIEKGSRLAGTAANTAMMAGNAVNSARRGDIQGAIRSGTSVVKNVKTMRKSRKK